jgi:hypothetical protein
MMDFPHHNIIQTYESQCVLSRELNNAKLSTMDYSEVYIAIPEVNIFDIDKYANYNQMIYASKCYRQALSCIVEKNTRCKIHVELVHLNTSNVGHMPSTHDTHDTFVDDMTNPFIYIACHRDVIPVKGWIIEHKKYT